MTDFNRNTEKKNMPRDRAGAAGRARPAHMSGEKAAGSAASAAVCRGREKKQARGETLPRSADERGEKPPHGRSDDGFCSDMPKDISNYRAKTIDCRPEERDGKNFLERREEGSANKDAAGKDAAGKDAAGKDATAENAAADKASPDGGCGSEAMSEEVCGDDRIDESSFDFRRHYSEEAYKAFFDSFEANPGKRYSYRFVKRSFDIVISFTALILLSPLFVVVAVAVKIDSRGPVFFTHLRMGRNGKPFKCYKFRSMLVDAPRDLAKEEFSDRERYLTRVGRVLRRLSLDELPQLFCCLLGTMSLIGPRPVVLTETELIEARRALGAYAVRPGLSGYAQVRGRDDVCGRNKAILDALYVKNASSWLDFKLLVLTVGCVLSRRGNSSEPIRR